ncbi:AbrB/MazE/SpoVT family DNA-binding domain-containing protein [Tellurirhabdus rosea]|uniref:AbrB/MazE/SpoVT family DNA-binding domain-containing protein n=1 Tax=Tellurirhabdus rosea TaxID=2674997 RepID=UPI002257006E|nr:AbrB/MazE/SpoVT family DNA-binding domain-containing protein [Tellurirhabdus rosea]
MTHELILQPIGKSWGVILPEEMLEAAGLRDAHKVSVQVIAGGIFLSAVHRKPREGWAESIDAYLAAGGKLEGDVFEAMSNQSDETHWTWPEK